MSDYPESLLSAARAVKAMRDRRARDNAQSSSWLQGALYGDSRPSEIMVAEDLKRREQNRRDGEIEAHYERELARYELSKAGPVIVSPVTGMKAYNVATPEGRAALDAAMAEKPLDAEPESAAS